MRVIGKSVKVVPEGFSNLDLILGALTSAWSKTKGVSEADALFFHWGKSLLIEQGFDIGHHLHRLNAMGVELDHVALSVDKVLGKVP